MGKNHLRANVLEEGVLLFLCNFLDVLREVLSGEAWRPNYDAAHLGVTVLPLEQGLQLRDDLVKESIFGLGVLVIKSL